MLSAILMVSPSDLDLVLGDEKSWILVDSRGNCGVVPDSVLMGNADLSASVFLLFLGALIPLRKEDSRLTLLSWK